MTDSLGQNCVLDLSIPNCRFGGPDHTCALCQQDYKLSADRRSCEPNNCKTGCFQCGDASTCLICSWMDGFVSRTAGMCSSARVVQVVLGALLFAWGAFF